MERNTMNCCTERIAIVTGASKGIGSQTAIALARKGFRLVLAVRNPESAVTTVSDVDRSGGNCTVERCDMAQTEDIQALVSKVLAQFGRIDAIVNNAASIGPIGHVSDTDPDEWDLTLRTNVSGPYFLVKNTLPALLQRNGTVINVSTGAAFTPREGWSAYCSSKAALAMLTRCLDVEYGNKGLKSYSFQPGLVDTDMQHVIRASGMNQISRIPREDLLPPSIPAEVIAWLVDTQPADLSGKEIGVHMKDLMDRAIPGIKTE